MTTGTKGTPVRRARRHTFIANKGGVGKTLWVIELAAALARLKKRVLVVDCDPQGNLTRRARAVVTDETPTLMTVLDQADPDAATAIQACGWDVPEAEYVNVLPTDIDFETMALRAGVPGTLRKLRQAIDKVAEHYDDILFDCPPSLGFLTQLAVTALGDGKADGKGKRGYVYLATDPETDGIIGAKRGRAFIEGYAPDLFVPDATIRAVLVNRMSNTSLHKARMAQLPSEFPPSEYLPQGIPVWTPPVKHRARIAELHDAGRPTSSDTDMRREGVVAGFDGMAKLMIKEPS